MAEGGSYTANFKLFATKAEKKEATSKDIDRWFKDANLINPKKKCNSNNLDICFSAVKTKGKTTITCTQMETLIDKVADSLAADCKISKDQAKVDIKSKLASTAPKAHGTTGVANKKTTEKMTDAKGYTGSHKERFDESGKGKGKAGRENLVENTGYVGNYKGKDTYDK